MEQKQPKPEVYDFRKQDRIGSGWHRGWNRIPLCGQKERFHWSVRCLQLLFR